MTRVDLLEGERLTWTEMRNKAHSNGFILPLKQDLQNDEVANRETDTWVPVRRTDGLSDDWVQIGPHDCCKNRYTTRCYCSILDDIGLPPWSTNASLEGNFVPPFFYGIGIKVELYATWFTLDNC